MSSPLRPNYANKNIQQKNKWEESERIYQTNIFIWKVCSREDVEEYVAMMQEAVLHYSLQLCTKMKHCSACPSIRPRLGVGGLFQNKSAEVFTHFFLFINGQYETLAKKQKPNKHAFTSLISLNVHRWGV